MKHTALLIVAALLAGCGGAPAGPAAAAPTAASVAVNAPAATVAPTEAPKPTATAAPTNTPAPKPTAVKTAPGLGISRAVLQSKFEGDPFNVTFKDDPDAKDEPGVKGTSATKSVTVYLLGPPENIREAQVQLLGGDHESNAIGLRTMIALLEVAAPGIKNPTIWLEPHLNRALKNTTDTAIEAGRTITVIATPSPSIIILSIQAAP